MTGTSTISFKNGETRNQAFAAKKLRVERAKSGNAEALSHMTLALAELLDLQSQANQAAWNVKGQGALGLQSQLKDFSAELNRLTHRIASRLKVLGGNPVFSVASVAEMSKLPPHPRHAASMDEHVDALLASYAAIIAMLPQSMKIALSDSDYPTASLITDAAALLEEHYSRLSTHQTEHWVHHGPATAVNQ